MTMNQMQYFSTVCRYHNITTAAKILMISQPGLSARLSELEAEVGVKLLERTSKGVSPTEEGARLLAHVEAVLGRYRLLQNDLPACPGPQHSPGGLSPLLRRGGDDPAVPGFSAVFPGDQSGVQRDAECDPIPVFG